MQFSNIKTFYQKHNVTLGHLAAILIPIKLSLTYIVLLPSLTLWFISNTDELIKRQKKLPLSTVPLFLFITIAAMSSCFGMDVANSIKQLVRFAFLSCSIFFFYDVVQEKYRYTLLLSLIAGQTISSLHTILQSAFPAYIPHLFIGTVTESGQLSLTIVVAFGLCTFFKKLAIEDQAQESTHGTLAYIAKGRVFLSILCFAILCFIAFSAYIESVKIFAIVLSLSAIVLSGLGLIYFYKQRSTYPFHYLVINSLVIFVIPILATALLVNLKRGPWVGVLIGMAVFLSYYARRLLIPLCIFVVCLFIFLQPLRQRLEESSRDFFIAGGRSVIWDIGLELSLKYPLGIGYDNSQFLRNYSLEIPEELKHFHNNYLNIIVETGWLGLTIFLWFVFTLLYLVLKSNLPPPYLILVHSIGCAILSWQIAGFVEYNIGDSEVYLIVCLLIGALTKIDANMDDRRIQ